MKEYEYILQQAKKFHYSTWNNEELRKCVDMLPKLSREELLMVYQNGWLQGDKAMKDAILQLLFKDRIGERDRKIKAMNVDELISNLHEKNGYGKFIVLEMKERFDSLDDEEKIKIINALSVTTKANQKWAEVKQRQITKKV